MTIIEDYVQIIKIHGSNNITTITIQQLLLNQFISGNGIDFNFALVFDEW